MPCYTHMALGINHNVKEVVDVILNYDGNPYPVYCMLRWSRSTEKAEFETISNRGLDILRECGSDTK